MIGEAELSLLNQRMAICPVDERFKRGIKYKFSAAGIHIETFVSKTGLSWAAIHRVKEWSSEFIVYTSGKMVFTLPKRCFESSQELIGIRQLFSSYVKDSKLRRD